ncbi:MAG TPA: hypothetical protein VIJ35_25950 [Bradyrhizobium sp.]
MSGVVAAILIAVGGFFGFQLYTQYRVANEIEAAFEQIRATGAKASHGKVSFDLKSRTVTVADIAGETTAQPPVSVKIASVTASGVSQPGTARFSADSIDLTDIEIGVEMPSETLLRVTYRAPRIAVKDYSGPTGIQRLPASSSFIDLYRFGFEQLAIMRATSVVAPSLTGKMKFSAAMRGGSGDGDFTYSGLAVEGLEDGRVAAMKADDFRFTFVQPAGKTKTITGNLANFVAYDTDFNAMAAIYDTQKANGRPVLPRLPANFSRGVCDQVRSKPDDACRGIHRRRSRHAAVAAAIAGADGDDATGRNRTSDPGAGAQDHGEGGRRL